MRQNGRPSRYATLGRRRLLGAAGLPLLAIGGGPARAGGRVELVATFSILRDLAQSVAGRDAEAIALVGNGGDVHSYQGKPADVQRLSRAAMLVSNGLGFEPWLPRLLGAGHFAGRHVVASEGVEPLVHASAPGAADRIVDPHCWHDVANARRYAANIATALQAVDPPNASAYRERAAAFDAKLATLDAWIRAEIARVPADRRRVITSHDAFAYLGHAYGVAFLAVRGMNAEQEPSARTVAQLIQLVRKEKTKALFFENLGSPVLIQQIARDSGGVVGRELYPDALSPPGGPAASYEALMRHNVSALVAGMLAA